MRPVPPRPSISAVATARPIATSSEPTKVSAGPAMRLMNTATGMPAAAKRARSSASPDRRSVEHHAGRPGRQRLADQRLLLADVVRRLGT
jgi:hypothetical protein